MTKVDVLQELTKLKQKGIDTTKQIIQISMSENIPEDVLDFIREHNKTEFDKFVEKTHKLYKTKNNKLYYSIMNYEKLTTEEKLKCLSSYITNFAITIEQSGLSENDYDDFMTDSCARLVGTALAEYFSYRYNDNRREFVLNNTLRALRNLFNKHIKK